MGAIFLIDGVICGWFSSALTESDCTRFGWSFGSPDGQQTWEALCLLVALRVWRHLWYLQRLEVEVRSDNLATLYLLSHLKSSSRSLNLIGRELALEFGNCTWKPLFQSHTPGVANVIPDSLSRQFQPDKQFVLPFGLTAEQEFTVPVRDAAYYLAEQPPD